MHFTQEPIFQWLAQYAYEPGMVYMIVVAMMIASAFGFPLPEEVTIISVGILAFMGAHPQHFPPPYPGAPVINGYEAAVVVSLSVFFADLLVFWIGRTFGRKIMRHRRLRTFFEGPTMEKINHYVKKYGALATFIFRFTPGIRFPAHIFLGMSKFSKLSFCLVDGIAVLVSVPTQILIVYHFGEEILGTLYQFKIYVGAVLAILLAVVLIRKYGPKLLPKKKVKS